MFRSLLAGAFAAGLVIAAGLPTTAQEKKPQPKKERIAAAEPKDAAKDPDFAIQGEYAGEITLGGSRIKTGAHVIAKGAGEFDVKMYSGGLPGAGWDQKTVMRGSVKRTDKAVSFSGKDALGRDVTGSIVDGKLSFKAATGEESGIVKVWRESKTLGEKPPAGATVLFAAEGDEKNWSNGRLLELSDGKFLTVAKLPKPDGKKHEGNITSKEKFGAFKAHIEFRLPWMPNSSGQGRGNSGVYLQDRYECQVLDSFGLSGEHNECGGFYQAYKPDVNMCLPPLAWQTYDIDFTPAEFGADGKKTRNARATVYHNGVKIHDNVELKKESGGGQKEDATPGPFQFQDHGDPVVFRNVWVVAVK